MQQVEQLTDLLSDRLSIGRSRHLVAMTRSSSVKNRAMFRLF